MYSCPCANRRLECVAGEVALELERWRAARCRFRRSTAWAAVGAAARSGPCDGRRRLYAASGIAAGGQVGIGDHFDRLVDVIEDDQFVVKPEQQVGDVPIIFRRGCELLALVVSDRVVPGVSDQAAGECGKMFVADDSGGWGAASAGRPADRWFGIPWLRRSRSRVIERISRRRPDKPATGPWR